MGQLLLFLVLFFSGLGGELAQRAYASPLANGKTPSPVSSTEPDMNETKLEIGPTKSPKVYIRLVSTYTTSRPSIKVTVPDDDRCQCQPVDTCPIELMDFGFGVSCQSGSVKCCKPKAPVTTPKSTVLEIITPASTVPSATEPTSSCNCTLKEHCENSATESSVDLSCPNGMVHCCTPTAPDLKKEEKPIQLPGNINSVLEESSPSLPNNQRVSEELPLEIRSVEQTGTMSGQGVVTLQPDPTQQETQEQIPQFTDRPEINPPSVQQHPNQQQMHPFQGQGNQHMQLLQQQHIFHTINPIFQQLPTGQQGSVQLPHPPQIQQMMPTGWQPSQPNTFRQPIFFQLPSPATPGAQLPSFVPSVNRKQANTNQPSRGFFSSFLGMFRD